MELTPALVMSMWSSGLAGGAALVSAWRVVGRGYSWLAAGVLVLFGLAAALAGGGAAAWSGLGLVLVAGLAAPRPIVAGSAFGVAALAFAVAGWADSGLLPVMTGAVFLGGITSEMMLGHWYLVDPTLPRWALQRLVVFGGAGLLAEAAYLSASGALDWSEAGTAIGGAYVALTLLTALLAVGVWFSLKEPRYTGVMAATGLSYLATLTAVGAGVVGRMVAFT